MLQAVADGEADAAAVTPVSAGYFNTRASRARGDHHCRPDERRPALVVEHRDWDAQTGRHPASEAMDEAMEPTRAKDGTIAGIYGRYGVTLLPPK